MSRTIELNGFDNGTICSVEAVGLSKCLLAYADIIESIMEIGFNSNSGYTYIALDNGISICSNMGNDVEYLVTNPEDGQETFFDDYETAENFSFTL